MKKVIYLILLSLSACNYPQDGPTNNISQTSAIIDYKNGLMFFDTKGQSLVRLYLILSQKILIWR